MCGILSRRKIQKRLEKSEKLAAVANFIDATGRFE
jgi:hypothetical protein